MAYSNTLRYLAFNNSLQANIISTVSSGEIIVTNSAACKLLGYSQKELLTKNGTAIFDTTENSFKKMLKQRNEAGRSSASVTAIKKNGKHFSCEITSSVFTGKNGIEKSITTITDTSGKISDKEKILEERLEKERSDIGKELHDNVNQLLGASSLYLAMAKRGGKDREINFNRSSNCTLSAIEEIRKLTQRLTTDAIKNLGLCESIDNIVRDTMQASGLKITRATKSFKEHSVNDKFKLNIFRIVQEQINNILKHAHATKVIIALSQNEKFIILGISDNGVGFDTAKKNKGIGVINIKSRAASYSGTADFVSAPEKGCVLKVTFPVTDALLPVI